MRWLFLQIFVLSFVGACRSTQSHFCGEIDSRDNSVVDHGEFEIPVENALENSTIENLVELGLSNNPQVREAEYRIAALEFKVPQALSLPDPMVNTTTHLSPVQTAAGEQAFALGVSQKFVNANRRATKASMIQDEIAVARATLGAKRNEIAEKIRIAGYQLLFVKKSIEVVQQDLKLLKQIESVVISQLEAGRSTTQQDALNVENEIATVRSRLIALQQQLNSYRARLAKLIGQPLHLTFDLSDSLDLHNTDHDLTELIQSAFQNRPDLQAQLAQVSRDRKAVALAELQNLADFTLGLNWVATSSSGISPVANGDDALMLGIGFNWPIYQERIQAGICEAQSIRSASRMKLDSLKDQAAEEIYDLSFRLTSTGATHELVKSDLIPNAKRILDLAIEEYAEGKVSYVQLIENWRALLKHRIDLANLQSQYGQLRASLLRAIGKSQPNSQTGEVQAPEVESDYFGPK